MGPQGVQGPPGPEGPAGPALPSLDALAGLPCNTADGPEGVVEIVYADPPSDALTLTCTSAPVTLSVTKDGDGTGTVFSQPAGIACGATCSHAFTRGTTVTLEARGDAGSWFAGWSGACTGTAPCVVTLDEAHTVTATFTTSPTADIYVAAEESFECDDPSGDVVQCTFYVGNGGPHEAGAVVSITVPDSFTVSSAVDPNSSCEVTGSTVQCTADWVPVHGDWTDPPPPQLYWVEVTASAPGPGTYTTAATVELLAGTDPQPGNNTVVVMTTIQ